MPLTHDTIVVCTHAQLREAAIVLSCFPSERLTPLVVLEPMPCTEAEYRQLHEAYRQARDQRDAAIGGQFGQLEVLAGKARVISNEEVDAAAERLTPYRSWWKHLLFISDLLDKIRPRRAIFLVEPGPEEVSPINPTPMAAIGDERVAFLPESMERMYVLPAQLAETSAPNRHTYLSLANLAEIAWRLCGPGGDFPANAVEVPEKATAHYLAGLCRALRTRLPLRPVDRPPPSLETECLAANASVAAPSEAVLIEVSDDATCLLGVQYAQQCGAKLVLSPALNPDTVNAALRAMEACQQQAAKSRTSTAQSNPGGVELLGPLRRAWGFLFSDGASAAIHRIERAVSALVPDQVIKAVGGLDLTVFTSGVPYNFVKKSGVDWSNKTIGHIAGDTSLLILTELCLPEPEDGVGFNLLFDPGYFNTTETHDVLSELSKRVSYTLVLHGNAGSHQALGHLGGTIPLEVVFFNTHGGDQVLVLSDMVMPAYKIVQRTQLMSRPIVFNNSCLSWVGVGREFIRIGARAYVGTLWSVDARMAARYARTVLWRVIQINQPVCQAMRNVGIDPRTERAYIFVGTCRARLAAARPGGPERQRQRMVAAAHMLLQSTLLFFEHTRGTSDLVVHAAVQDLLVQEVEKLGAEIDQRWPEPSLDRLDLKLQYLKALVFLAARRPDDVLKKRAIIDETRRLLDALPLDARTRAERLSTLLDLAGHLSLLFGWTEISVNQLTQSVQMAEKAGLLAGPTYIELSDALKKLGKLPEAREAAEKARDAFTANPGGPPLQRERMLALGRLASISNWLGQFDAAAAHAREGFELASQLSDAGEQSEFKADETRALIGLKDFDRALKTANNAVYYARLAHNNSRELGGIGLIARVLISTGDATAALELANAGLTVARAHHQSAHVAEFLLDIADIAALQEKPARAYEALLEAVPLFVATGSQAKAFDALTHAAELRSKLDTWKAILEMLTVEIEIIDYVESSIRDQLATDCLVQLMSAIARAGLDLARAPLQVLVQAAAEVVTKRQGQASDHLRLVAEAVQMFDKWSRGEKARALEIASSLDQLSGGRFKLFAFVNGP